MYSGHMDDRIIKTYNRYKNITEPPSLIALQLDPYQDLKDKGIQQIFEDISPIMSGNGRYCVYFPDNSPVSEFTGLSWRLDPPEYTLQECIEKGLTYSNSLITDVLLRDTAAGNSWRSRICLGELPQMTAAGSFIISGTEKVVITQLVKSSGIYYSAVYDDDSGKIMQHAKIMPDKGTYIEIFPKEDKGICVQYDRRIQIPLTAFLRILCYADDGSGTSLFRKCSDAEIFRVFENECGSSARGYLAASVQAETKLYGDPSMENAARWFFKKNKQKGESEEIRKCIHRRFFDLAAYDLQLPGRRKLNERLDLAGTVPDTHRTLTVLDVVKAAASVIRLQESGQLINDDIDHLGNRHTRSCGELILRAFSAGMREMERQICRKLNFIPDPKEIRSAEDYIDPSPVNYALRSFFASSELCQFMDQNNPLSELRQKRTISALGPNGLDRSRAGFDVRDIHHTHYGRLCPVETPEGKNSGLISRLSIYGSRNEYGYLETPYRVVFGKAAFRHDDVIGRVPAADVKDTAGNLVFRAGIRITREMADCTDFTNPEITEFAVIPYVTEQIICIDATEEDRYTIAQATSPLNEYGEFQENSVKCRRYPDFLACPVSEVDLLDISPQQAAGVSAACIPFLEHDDGHRALMGTNMLSQAVPLLYPEIPLVMTGMERYAALDSAQMLRSGWNGKVIRVDGSGIDLISDDNVLHCLHLRKYMRSNYATCINQKPAVRPGQTVEEGDVLADAACTDNGVLALGHNPMVAFLCWDGCNFEDAIVVSEKLVCEDKFTSLDIMRFEAKTVYTEAGIEEITRDIPGLNPESLAHLDERGIAKVGTLLKGGDVIIGRVSPRRENDPEDETIEEQAVRDVFGEKARRYRDTSVRLPSFMQARVIDVKVFTHDDLPEMESMTDLIVRVTLAKKRKLGVGDKMSGRHGNKGVVARIVPEEDMPYMNDGTPVDILLNPLGVPGRMNVGQILEVWLGWAASRLGIRCESPVFDSATVHDIEAELCRAWLFDTASEDFRNEAWDKTILAKSMVAKPKWNPWNFARNTRYYRVLCHPECFNVNEEKLVCDFAGKCLGKDFESERELKEKITLRWIENNGCETERIFSWENIPENSPAENPLNSNAIAVCLKLWLLRMNYPDPLPDSEKDLREVAGRWAEMINEPLLITGKQWLRDGRTGERYDHPVNVGVMNMIKLHHLAEDKVQARSTGGYSMITQQPLAGKLNKGGQRIGEMEVWALEAYGCAALLQEMLTIKSDDTEGRKKAGWNMSHGHPVEVAGIPASFRVLIHELMGLGLSLTGFFDDGSEEMLGLDDPSMENESGN